MNNDSQALRPHVDRLAGHHILVTGAASGLGLAIARRIVAEGARVAICDLDAAGAEAAAETLGDMAIAIPLDVTSEGDWQRCCDQVRSQWGRLDGVVNNAGITTMGSIEELDVADLRHELEVDVIGVFLGCKAGIALMKTTGGSIVNMSSAAGLKADPDLVGYNSAKAAVTMMTKSVALHCARSAYGIRCNSVHPGIIRTPIVDKVLSQVEDPEATLAAFLSVHPIGRMGTPEDIAAITAYLLSDESRFATGAAFSIDGGMTAL
ncbi:glucose 1-dehydrogenase [Parahaliea aestuarii]|uniref:Glucose 1-dehydrogenase n=1 Tax=Parahaliea aestuarii TaxID=1852021 RepID=A0A5C9A521_9GAMM|nr:glucose 1-dehydrogenase [Parahaliea aestuarii]TXS95082.1 glucose 1-dehydrogenase [Parahaliea aestuarii]